MFTADREYEGDKSMFPVMLDQANVYGFVYLDRSSSLKIFKITRYHYPCNTTTTSTTTTTTIIPITFIIIFIAATNATSMATVILMINISRGIGSSNRKCYAAENYILTLRVLQAARKRALYPQATFGRRSLLRYLMLTQPQQLNACV